MCVQSKAMWVVNRMRQVTLQSKPPKLDFPTEEIAFLIRQLITYIQQNLPSTRFYYLGKCGRAQFSWFVPILRLTIQLELDCAIRFL